MVGDEWACCRSSGYGLEDWGVDFDVSVCVEVFAHGVEHFCSFEEYVFDAFVDYEVDVALAVALFGVGECVVGFAVFDFDDRQGSEAF